MRKQIRKLRHWKQRWDKNAEFIWRRPTTYAGRLYGPGDPIPEELSKQPTKLRRFWESKRIELAEFDDPNVATGQPEPERSEAVSLPEGVTVAKGKGSWFVVTLHDDDEMRVNGQKALDELLGTLLLEDELEAVEAEDDGDEDDEADFDKNTGGVNAGDGDDDWLGEED